MKLKKIFGNITVYFDITGDITFLKEDGMLSDIMCSLENFKFIYRNKPFNELVKIQQKHPKHILVEFEPKPHDELKFIIKVIYNFLLVTNQLKYFMVDCVEITSDQGTIITYSTEVFRNDLTANITFSPTIRGYWNNPLTIEKILKLP